VLSIFVFNCFNGKFAKIPGMEWLTDSVAFGYVLKLRVCDLENVKEKR
jgi:hypothetical protein